jgi:flagellar motor switch protein FliM
MAGGDGKAPLISDEEVQALLDRAGPAAHGSAEARPYDLSGTPRITRGRLPTLEFLLETFARQFRTHLADLVRRELQVTYEGVQSQRSGDYLAALPVPACLDIVRARPLAGHLMFSIGPDLLGLLVDAFYGGPGRAGARDPDRGLTPTEARFARLVIRQATADLAAAFAPVAALEFEPVKQERSAHFVDIAGPTETLLINRFRIGLGDAGGVLDFVLPMASIEPLREVLASGAALRHTPGGAPWAPALARSLAEAKVEVRAVLAELELSLGELVRLKPGDVVPIEAPREAVLLAGDAPLYRARFGVSRGRNALTVTEAVRPGGARR